MESLDTIFTSNHTLDKALNFFSLVHVRCVCVVTYCCIYPASLKATRSGGASDDTSLAIDQNCANKIKFGIAQASFRPYLLST
jgi:hypothetical protein